MIKFDHGNSRFNFRSAAVVMHEKHLLIHKAVSNDFWALPGGRVEFFENSDKTIAREIAEELGFQCKVVRPLWYVENFFEYHGTKFHEVSTYYLTEITNALTINSDEEFDGIEADKDLVFKWIPLRHVAEFNLKPEFLKPKLRDMPSSVEFVQVNELSV